MGVGASSGFVFLSTANQNVFSNESDDAMVMILPSMC